MFFGFKTLILTAGFALGAISLAHAVEGEAPPVPHVLVYTNGDRVQGRLIAREGDTLVFKSVRFGELRVPVSEARVIIAPPGVKRALAVAPAQEDDKPLEEPDTPELITRLLKEFFGPWSGRLALSSQAVNDTHKRNDFTAEARLKRKWAKDEVSVSGRYNYSKTDNYVSSDVIKGNGQWRHTLPDRMFTVYRPAYEWNRAYSVGGVNSDYVLLQQEVGVGTTVLKTKNWEVRAGLAENLFDTWEQSAGGHASAHAESVFAEADLKLPWRISLAERAVYYYAFSTGNDGWDHQFEITKKLTDTLSLGLKHEIRYNDPDVHSQDYSLLRFLLGFDF